MMSINKVIKGDNISWTNYGALIHMWKTTNCIKCKKKYHNELQTFDKPVVEIWRIK